MKKTNDTTTTTTNANANAKGGRRLDVTALSKDTRDRLTPFLGHHIVAAYVERMDAADVKRAAAALKNFDAAKADGFDVEKYLAARDAYVAAKDAAEARRAAHRAAVPSFAWDDTDAALWAAVKGTTNADTVRKAVCEWEAARGGKALKGTRTLANIARKAVGGFAVAGRKALSKHLTAPKTAGALVRETAATLADDNGARFLSLLYFTLCDECIAKEVGVFALKDAPEEIRAAVKADSEAAARQKEEDEKARRERRAALVAAVVAAEVDRANARAAVERLEDAARKAHAKREKADAAVKAHGADVPALVREAAEKAADADVKAGEKVKAARATLATAENVYKKAVEKCEAVTGGSVEKAKEKVAADKAAGRLQ